jgi:hypothetical protein
MTTKLTVDKSEQTPSVQAVAKGAKTVTVTDPRGRRIVMKRPNVLAQYDLIEVLGDAANNQTYVGMVLPLLFVTEIDGEAESPLTSKLLVRALIQRLGEDGVNSVMKSMQEHFGADEEVTKEAIKK